MLRACVLTLNNFTEDEYRLMLGWEGWSYIIIGVEIAPTTGTPHLQAYGELRTRSRVATINRALGNRCWIESRRGTQDQAITYCKKGGNFVERGERRDQGHRADLDVARRVVVEDGMRELARFGTVQQLRVAQIYLTYNEEPRDWQPTVYWLWGRTGVGKSRRAREIMNQHDVDVYMKDATKWWDGYDGHEGVIMDDFRAGGAIGFADLLQILDRYEHRVECKGGYRQLRARVIVITTPFAPDRTFMGLMEDLQQLLRRISQLVEVVPDVPEVVG